MMAQHSATLALELLVALRAEGVSEDKISRVESSLKECGVILDTAERDNDDAVKRADELKAEGNAFLSNDNTAGAIRCYQEAIALQPMNAILHGNLSAAYLQAKDYAKAVSSAQACIAIDATYAKGYIRLSSALVGQGKTTEAREAIEDGLAVLPGNEQLEKHLQTLGQASPRSSPGMPAGLPDLSSMGGLAGLMNNPEIMRMASQMMEGNPQLAEMMRDPEQINRMMQMFQGPKK